LTTDSTTSGQDAKAQKLELQRRRRHRQWGGAALGVIFGLLGLLAGRLGHLYPAFDIFAQFGAQFLAVTLGFVLGSLLPRYRAIAGAAMAVALVIAYAAWPHYVSRHLAQGPFAIEPGERILRVAHFNTHATNSDNDAVAAEILRLDADVMTLIEFETERMPVLAKIAARFPYQYACRDVPYCNLAIISKYPLESVAGKGAWKGPPLIKARLGGALAGLTVIGVHTTRFPRFRLQLTQVQNLILELEGETGELLVMGDFNATPFSRLTGLVEEGAGLHRLTNLPSWPATFGFPQLAIDHIFAGDRLRVLATQQIGNPSGSDHYPIVMTLAFKPRSRSVLN
jgi:endonuclease/exonuclease/phosphatase (EEP) superfamily protein YafD